jgi:hypothetical protein
MTQLFAIVPVPEHTPPPVEAIVVGSLDDVLEYVPQSLSRLEAMQIRDAVGQALDYARQVQDYERSLKEQIQTFNDKCLAPVANRIDSFEKARAQSAKRAEAEQKRRDRQRVQAYIDGLPDPDAPDDDGELTIHHKVDPAARGYTFDPDDPDTWPEDDAALSTTLHDVGLEGSVTTRPTTTPAELAYPPSRNTRQVPQPISVSLNQE